MSYIFWSLAVPQMSPSLLPCSLLMPLVAILSIQSRRQLQSWSTSHTQRQDASIAWEQPAQSSTALDGSIRSADPALGWIALDWGGLDQLSSDEMTSDQIASDRIALHWLGQICCCMARLPRARPVQVPMPPSRTPQISGELHALLSKLLGANTLL